MAILDWIKINMRLPHDPRVLTIASSIASHAARYIIDPTHAKDLFGVTESVTCHALRDVTCMSLVRVWMAGNEHTTDGVFKNCSSIAYLDLLAGIPGFGAAMETVGWATFDSITKTITLPNFLEHNSPDKNGHRSRSAAAERKARQRERERLESLKEDSDTSHPERVNARDCHTKSHAKSQEENKIPSVSVSSSISESESGTQTQNPEKPQPPPATPEPPSLPELQTRINALRPKTWGRAPHWSYEDEAALFAALRNFQGLDAQDWLLLQWFMTWASTSANTSQKDAVKVTTRRHTFCTELPAYLDRATTAWKQAGCPKLAPSTPSAPRSRLPAAPVPDQSLEEARRATAALRASLHPGATLLDDLGIPTKPTPSPLPTTTAA